MHTPPQPRVGQDGGVGAEPRDPAASDVRTLTSILETITDGRSAFDRDWRFTFVNDRAETHYGRPRAELIGQVVWDIFPMARGTVFEREYRRAVAENVPVRFEAYSQIAKKWLEVFCFPLADGLSVNFRDISDRRRSQDALDAANRDLRLRVSEFETLLDVLPVSIAVSLDRESSVIRTNRACARMLRLDPHANASLTADSGERPTHFRVMHQGRTLAGHELPLQLAAREGREVRELEVDICFDDGTSISVLEYAAPLFDDDGQPRGSVGVFVDLTERLAAEHERERMLDSERIAHAEADRANQLKDEFLASISHELRTPLNAILGWAQLLRGRAPTPAFLEQGLETLERNAKLQAQLIDDLLDMSRILAGHVRLEVQQTLLARSVEAAVEVIRPAAEAKQITVQVVIDPRAGLVSGDPTRLQQVFWNVLSNAIKFTPRGGRVSVALDRVGAHLDVTVSDTGIGIASDFLPSVFERFRQADASTTRRHGGLGIGLSIARQLVELHGGSIRASSAGPGHGATFVVRLPVSAAAPIELDARRALPNARDTGATAPRVSLAEVFVLVVDDDEDARRLMTLVLEGCDARVEAVPSAPAALEAIARQCPDVIVSDIGLPGQDGYALIQAVRALGEEFRAIPALALTAFARSEDRRRALVAGFQLHLAKPVEPAELCTAVASLAGTLRS